MINQMLLWLLSIPVILALIVYAARREYKGSWLPCVGIAVIGLLITTGGFYLAKGSKTSDVEIWSGQVNSKLREQGSYEKSYDCNCVTVTKKDGTSTTSCQTCYETHYTVEWNCSTTIGPYEIEKFDSTSRSVYGSADPPRWTTISKGDPVAARKSYTNYVQAVPNSLFDPAAADVKARFAKMLPSYPDNVYDLYKVDRFVTVGWSPADKREWNDAISYGLRELGPRKQVNLIIVVAKTNDPMYEYALRDHWEGVNKNDVVLLIGSTEYPKIDFARVMSWTKNEMFKVELRDAVQEKGTIDQSLVPLALSHITKNFERRRMREFEYLDGEIDPPDWMVCVIIALLAAGAGGVWYMIPQWCGIGNRRR